MKFFSSKDKKTAKTTTPPKPWYREYGEALLVAGILALIIRSFVVQAFKIPSGSMEDTLLIGDHLLVNKFVFAPTLSGLERTLLPIDPVRRGDILVFKYPQDPERDFIKRVIGLPGETLEVRNKKVFINGKPLDEPYVHFLFPPEERAPGDVSFDLNQKSDYGPVTVPERQYFMMGDNRDNSEDSRYWGFMPADYIKGKALFVYFSFADPDQRGPGVFGGVRLNRLLHQIH